MEGAGRVAARVFYPELFWAGRNGTANRLPLLPSRAKKRKERSKTTTLMASVLSPPYPFWELVVTWSYRSDKVFNS